MTNDDQTKLERPGDVRSPKLMHGGKAKGQIATPESKARGQLSSNVAALGTKAHRARRREESHPRLNARGPVQSPPRCMHKRTKGRTTGCTLRTKPLADIAGSGTALSSGQHK